MFAVCKIALISFNSILMTEAGLHGSAPGAVDLDWMGQALAVRREAPLRSEEEGEKDGPVVSFCLNGEHSYVELPICSSFSDKVTDDQIEGWNIKELDDDVQREIFTNCLDETFGRLTARLEMHYNLQPQCSRNILPFLMPAYSGWGIEHKWKAKREPCKTPVSYTHLTLPTILLV